MGLYGARLAISHAVSNRFTHQLAISNCMCPLIILLLHSFIGYLGQMVFCDKCLDPSKGLAFRLARQNTSVGDLYDLCVQCYNEGDDEHIMSHFHCNIPSGNIDQDDDDV